MLLSAEGFRFLILPVQLTPFPVYPGLHVQAFSVVTESIGVALMLFCLTLVYVYVSYSFIERIDLLRR